MHDTRSRRRTASPLLSLPPDILESICWSIIRSQPLTLSAAAARSCKALCCALRPLLGRLFAATQLTLVRELSGFATTRHSLRVGNRLWVCDMNSHRVLGYSLATFEHEVTLTGFLYPWFLAASAQEDELYVAETSGCCIRAYRANDGVLLRSWRMRRAEDGDPHPTDEPVWTQGIAVVQGELLAARPEENIISAHDLSSGRELRRWAVPFDGTFGVSLAVINGLIFVSSGTRCSQVQRGRLRVYTPDGTCVTEDFCGEYVPEAIGVCALGGDLVAVSTGRSPSTHQLVFFTLDGTLVRHITIPNTSVPPRFDLGLLSADERHLFLSTGRRVLAFRYGVDNGPLGP